MYLYAYDSWVTEAQYARDVADIENRLTDLGIASTVVRLGLFRDHIVALKSEIRKGGIRTIVAVGDDATLQKTLDAVGDDKQIVVGYIPITPKNGMANLLGIPSGVSACDVLSARLVEHLDAGEVNGRKFLHNATFEAENVVFTCEQRYTVTPKKKCVVEFRNFSGEDAQGIASPSDGKLTMLIRVPVFSLFSKKEYVTRIPVSHVFLKSNKPISVFFDKERISSGELHFSCIPGRVRVIVGREKKF